MIVGEVARGTPSLAVLLLQQGRSKSGGGGGGGAVREDGISEDSQLEVIASSLVAVMQDDKGGYAGVIAAERGKKISNGWRGGAVAEWVKGQDEEMGG